MFDDCIRRSTPTLAYTRRARLEPDAVACGATVGACRDGQWLAALRLLEGFALQRLRPDDMYMYVYTYIYIYIYSAYNNT